MQSGLLIERVTLTSVWRMDHRGPRKNAPVRGYCRGPSNGYRGEGAISEVTRLKTSFGD